jgi:hypothetical protein
MAEALLSTATALSHTTLTSQEVPHLGEYLAAEISLFSEFNDDWKLDDRSC